MDTPSSNDNPPASPFAHENPSQPAAPERANLNRTGSGDLEHGDNSEHQCDHEENIEPEADNGCLDQINDETADTEQHAASNPV